MSDESLTVRVLQEIRDGVRELRTDLCDRIDQTRDSVRELRTDLCDRIDKTNARLDQTNAKVDHLGERVDLLGTKLDHSNARLETLVDDVSQLRFETRQRFDSVLTLMRERHHEVAGRLDALEVRVERLESR